MTRVRTLLLRTRLWAPGSLSNTTLFFNHRESALTNFNIHYRPALTDWVSFMRQPGADKVWSRKRVFYIPGEVNRGWLIVNNVPVLYFPSVQELLRKRGSKITGFVANDLRERFPAPNLSAALGELKEGFFFPEFVH